MPNVPAWIRSWPRARHPRPHPGRGTHPLCADATSRNQPTCSRNGFPASCAPAAQDRLARSVKPVRASVTSDACHRVRAPRSRHGHVNEAGRKRSTPTFLPRARTGRPSLTKPPPSSGRCLTNICLEAAKCPPIPRAPVAQNLPARPANTVRPATTNASGPLAPNPSGLLRSRAGVRTVRESRNAGIGGAKLCVKRPRRATVLLRWHPQKPPVTACFPARNRPRGRDKSVRPSLPETADRRRRRRARTALPDCR